MFKHFWSVSLRLLTTLCRKFRYPGVSTNQRTERLLAFQNIQTRDSSVCTFPHCFLINTLHIYFTLISGLQKESMEKHEKARRSLCLICLDRSSQAIPNTKYQALVEMYVVQDYCPLDPRLPSGLCYSCATKLARFESGSFDQVLPEFPDYAKMASFRPSRGMISCTCDLCGKYRVVGLTSSRRKSRKLKPGQHASRVSLSEANSDNVSTRPTGIFCTKCFQMLYRGCKHPCTQRSLQSNVRKLIPDKTLEQVTRSILVEISRQNESLTLASSGLPTRVALAPEMKGICEKPKLEVKTLLQIKTNTGMSSRTLLKVAQGVRSDVDVESGLYKALTVANNRWKNFFDHSVEKLPGNGSYPVIFCNNPEEFIHSIVIERGITNEDIFLRLSIDEGKGFLKISGNLVLKNPANERSPFLTSGVKKTFILAIAPMKESYESIRILLPKLNLNFSNNVEQQYSQDLKCCNIVFGFGNHKSTYPCIYCFWIAFSRVKGVPNIGL